ncbi:MAG: gamma-glutamylcyclotransferase family protein [Pseudomonadota bacterium]
MPFEDRHVFVYGTLCRGEQRDINKLNPRPEFIREAYVHGTLYDLGTYPGIVLGGQGAVRGEVYGINAELESLLDEIEEVWPQQTGEYAKREVQVQLKDVGNHDRDMRSMSCLIYEITASHTEGKPVIEGGDWVQYRKRQMR